MLVLDMDPLSSLNKRACLQILHCFLIIIEPQVPPQVPDSHLHPTLSN